MSSTKVMRLSEDIIEACYGTRDKYLKICALNLKTREKEIFRNYYKMQIRFGIKLLTEKQWGRAQIRQLRLLRANIISNQHEPF